MLKTILSYVAAFLFIFVMIIIDYSMIQQIYRLLIVPLGAPALSIGQLICVGLFLQAIVETPEYEDKPLKDKLKKAFSKTFTIAFIWLLAIIISVVGN